MKTVLILLLLVVLLVAGLALYVRLAPVDPARWHVDPALAEAPPLGSWRAGPGLAAPVPVLLATPQEVLAALDAIARSTPRTQAIAGSVAEGRITYETRSALWGFPDYTTVEAVAVEGGAAPVLLARLRFGDGDMGVNRARVEQWLAGLTERLPPGLSGP